MANTYLYRTFSTPTNTKKYTYSLWVKRGILTNQEILMSAGTGASNGDFLCFRSNDQIEWQMYHGSNVGILKTNRVFRDCSAWMHIQIAYDSANATAGDRMKMYINGVEETSFATDTQPTLNLVSYINSAVQHNIGYDTYGLAAGYFTGSLSHVNFVDGQAYAPTVFGSFDATDDIWKIKTGPTMTMGINGFTILKDGNTITDQSSNSNNWTSNGTGVTATKDNPSNNVCTFNFSKKSTDGTNTFSNGNTIFSNTGGTQWHQSGGTISATKGKYYYEADINYTPGSLNTQFGWGAVDMQQITLNLNNPLGKLDTSGGSIVNYAPSTGFYDTGAYMYSTISSQDNQVNSSFAAAISGSVIMIAIDLDNGKFYVGKDGTWDTLSSSNPSAGTGGKSFTPGGFSYSPWVASYNAGPISINFGNGYFGSTVIGSAVSAGEGLWKYTPPTNYGAFCTKNINAA